MSEQNSNDWKGNGFPFPSQRILDAQCFGQVKILNLEKIDSSAFFFFFFFFFIILSNFRHMLLPYNLPNLIFSERV